MRNFPSIEHIIKRQKIYFDLKKDLKNIFVYSGATQPYGNFFYYCPINLCV